MSEKIEQNNNEKATEVTVEKITKIQSLETEVTCDNGHTFISKTALLLPFNASEDTDIGNTLIVTSAFDLYSGLPEGVITGYLLACPVCNLVHLGGFREASKGAKVAPGKDNSIPERELNPDL